MDCLMNANMHKTIRNIADEERFAIPSTIEDPTVSPETPDGLKARNMEKAFDRYQLVPTLPLALLWLLCLCQSCGIGERDTTKVGTDLSTQSGDTVVVERMLTLEFEHALGHEVHFLDVVGDAGIDTLILGPFDGEATMLSLLDRGVRREVLRIAPRMNADYVTTRPPVERIFLEGNHVQSSDKSLRLIIRNTDHVGGEYCFFDIHLSSGSVVVGNCGMYSLGDDHQAEGVGRTQLCTARYGRELEPLKNGTTYLYPQLILERSWPGGHVCDIEKYVQRNKVEIP